MSTLSTTAQVEQLQREATSLHRSAGIPLADAFDRIAAQQGHVNWASLMRHVSEFIDSRGAFARPAVPFTRTPEQMRIAMREVAGRGAQADGAAKKNVFDISGEFASPRDAVDFSIAFMMCLLSAPRFKVYRSAQVYWEMRWWLPYCVSEVRDHDETDVRILLNRHYKPVGMVPSDWVKYEDFPNLQASLTRRQRLRLTRPWAQEGYLFDDGCPPWDSRRAAVDYLDRLHVLRALLAP
ncbi:hypothetical protein J7U46_13320 [Pelomonas sp. V22]|uniref:hypothetical protein n=1 Tax=Pelomonas sp. V22 TaxID=2822139 RepID=UPI0024A8BBC9|nr:hypothetical protein [Pelomonas sp. V22]MDI4634032.1 hypothetical protein [Pelomonas sp. V22]